MVLDIEWLNREEAEAAGSMEVRVLLEQTPEHYPEFQAFLENELQRGGGELFFRGESGSAYRVGWLKDTRLRGIEVCVRKETGDQALGSQHVDADLWLFLEWLVRGVGGDWTLEALRETGAIYNAPGPEKEI